MTDNQTPNVMSCYVGDNFVVFRMTDHGIEYKVTIEGVVDGKLSYRDLENAAALIIQRMGRELAAREIGETSPYRGSPGQGT